MAPKSKKSEIQALQSQLRDESSDTPIASEASTTIEDLCVQPNVVIEQPYTRANARQKMPPQTWATVV